MTLQSLRIPTRSSKEKAIDNDLLALDNKIDLVKSDKLNDPESPENVDFISIENKYIDGISDVSTYLGVDDFDNPIIVTYSWVHGVMPNGVVIWEAFDYNTEELISGYWVALRKDENGKWEKVSHLRMTEAFFNNWYEYTYKDNSKPNELKLISWDYLNSGNPYEASVTASSYVTTLTLNSSDELVVSEVNNTIDATWSELYTNEFGSFTIGIEAEYPTSDSDDDWFGMQKGEHAGWVWIYDGDINIGKYAGFNMLTGETYFVDISANTIFDGLTSPLLSSSAKYRFILTFSNNLTKGSLYFWSDLFNKPNIVTEVTAYDHQNIMLDQSLVIQRQFIDKYLYAYSVPQSNQGKGYYINIVRINVDNGIVEYIKSPRFSNLENIGGGTFNMVTFVTYNSLYLRVSSIDQYYGKTQDMPSLNINDNHIKFFKSNIYPHNIGPDSIIEYDSVWDYQAIISTVETFKKDSFI